MRLDLPSPLFVAALGIALALVGVGCSGGGDDPSCIEGTSQPCACTSGATGAQTCLASGGFAACVCGAGSDGGLDGSEAGMDGGADAPMDASMDAPSPSSPCERACDHVYLDCSLHFSRTDGSTVSQVESVADCEAGAFNAVQRECFSTNACDALDPCFTAGMPRCPADADCATRACGLDPVCGEVCGGCAIDEACGLGGACAAATGWVLDDLRRPSVFTFDIAVDGAGLPHLAFITDSGELHHGVWADGRLDSRLVAMTGRRFDVGAFRPAIAIDADNQPHLVYPDAITGGVRYAVRTGGGWVKETIDPGVDAGDFADIAVDAGGLVHVVYRSAGLVYAHRDLAGVWSIEDPDPSPFGGLVARIELGPLPGGAEIVPHLAHALAYRSARYGYRDPSGSWAFEEAAAENCVFLDFELSPGGEPQLAFFNREMGAARYAFRAASMWTVETASAAGSGNAFCALASDSTSLPLILFAHSGTDQVWASRRSAAGIWATEIVDPITLAGRDIQLALGPSGVPWAAYTTLRSGDDFVLTHQVP